MALGLLARQTSGSSAGAAEVMETIFQHHEAYKCTAQSPKNMTTCILLLLLLVFATRVHVRRLNTAEPAADHLLATWSERGPAVARTLFDVQRCTYFPNVLVVSESGR